MDNCDKNIINFVSFVIMKDSEPALLSKKKLSRITSFVLSSKTGKS